MPWPETAFADLLAQTGNKGDATPLINADTQITPDLALTIYANNALGAQLSALQSTYSVCHALVGENCFKNLCNAYASTHPMKDRDLNLYGDQFPTFIRIVQNDHPALGALNYLADMAELERAINLAYYADDAGQFDLKTFGNLSPKAQGNLKFQIQPALTLITNQYPLNQIYYAHRDNTLDDLQITRETTRFFLVDRPRYQAEVHEIQATEHQMISAIVAGFTFNQLCETHPKDTHLFKKMITQGWICGFN